MDPLGVGGATTNPTQELVVFGGIASDDAALLSDDGARPMMAPRKLGESMGLTHWIAIFPVPYRKMKCFT